MIVQVSSQIVTLIDATSVEAAEEYFLDGVCRDRDAYVCDVEILDLMAAEVETQ